MALRRLTNIRVESSGFWVFKTYKFYYTKTRHFVLSPAEYQRAKQRQVSRVGRDQDRVLWWTAQGFYWAEPELDEQAVELLVWNRQRRQESQLERLEKIRDRGITSAQRRREQIPDEVRIAVWERDGGRCVRCDSDHELQFDHIIPFARGGGINVENVQILCGDCNRAKSDSII